MVKYYKTQEEGIADIVKKSKTIINAYNKMKYSNIFKHVFKTEQGYVIGGTFWYPDCSVIVNGDDIKFKMEHWENPVPITSCNIGAIRAIVDFLIDFTVEMKSNFN